MDNDFFYGILETGTNLGVHYKTATKLTVSKVFKLFKKKLQNKSGQLKLTTTKGNITGSLIL